MKTLNILLIATLLSVMGSGGAVIGGFTYIEKPESQRTSAKGTRYKGIGLSHNKDAQARLAFYKQANLDWCKGEVYEAFRESFRDSFEEAFKKNSDREATPLLTDAACATAWTVIMMALFPDLKDNEMATLLEDGSDTRWVPALAMTSMYSWKISLARIALERDAAKFPDQAFKPE